MANKEVKKVKEVKYYKFKHNSNPYFMVAYLGVQFRDGLYKTEDRGIAEKLINFEGVELISQP